jgi:hypothetical protein
MIDPQKNLVTINAFTLFMLCAGCVCVTVMIALPHMIERTGDAIVRLELQKIGEKQK